MTKHEINELYEESVYQIRLRVAISLLGVPGLSLDNAFEEADKFVARLQQEELNWLRHRFK